MLPATLGLLASLVSVSAQDAPAFDTGAMMKELLRFRELQSGQSKQSRLSVLQTVNAAAASPEKAAALWEEAVRAVQFSGLSKDGVEFRGWREKEGDALNTPLGKSAVRLYFMWLSITIQRDGGVPVKDLLPQIFGYIKEVVADEAAADAVEDAVKREKEQASNASNTQNAAARKGAAQPVHGKDERAKRVHDAILRAGLGAGPVAQWMKLDDFINPEGWEKSPGNIDGIYQNIVLPEFRSKGDVRALDYWDFKIKRDGDNAARTHLAFELDKFNSVRRPQLLWKRAEELNLLGQRNRAMTTMMALIKANPAHPDVVNWMQTLESMLQPPPAAAAEAAPASN